jgi:uncharacterized membrane protein YgaE (UPF0421/DUF939 family)
MGKFISLGRAFVLISMIGFVCAFTFSNVFAQDEAESLKQRLDRLEKQNDDLRKLLEQKNGLPNITPAKKELTKTTSLTNTPQALMQSLPILNYPTFSNGLGKMVLRRKAKTKTLPFTS